MITPEIVDEVLRLHSQNPKRFSPFKASRSVGIDVADVFQIIEQNKDRLNRSEEQYGGFGRPDIQQYVVARRRADEREWDNTDPAIAKARADYEAGTHEMATGRDGSWLILYSIPRKVQAHDRVGYFTPEIV